MLLDKMFNNYVCVPLLEVLVRENYYDKDVNEWKYKIKMMKIEIRLNKQLERRTKIKEKEKHVKIELRINK